ncbi:MAG: hypothetical protein FWF56_05790 [Firmicutes bacterium]|nr:hypothetical protein [Bacillota bacterium]MCL1953411.1 hypothetical protein [Bacillota bacterium]
MRKESYSRKGLSKLTMTIVLAIVLVLSVTAVLATILNSKVGVETSVVNVATAKFKSATSQTMKGNTIVGDNAIAQTNNSLGQHFVLNGLDDVDGIEYLAKYFDDLAQNMQALLSSSDDSYGNFQDNVDRSDLVRGRSFLGIRMSRQDIIAFMGCVDKYYITLTMAELAAEAAAFALAGTAYFAIFTAWINAILVIGQIIYGMLLAAAVGILTAMVLALANGHNGFEFGVAYDEFWGIPTGVFELVCGWFD